MNLENNEKSAIINKQHSSSYKKYIFWISIFLSAFLLFLIEPMVVRSMLPKLGGSYAVWGVSIFVFQTILLLGYLWAHLLQEKLGVYKYSKIHLVLLFIVFIVCPFGLDNLSTLPASFSLFLNTIYILIRVIGFPFFILSTSSLVLQKWFTQSNFPESKNPYFLYSASNLGSILGLISYPIIFEPYILLKYQDYLWWGIYLILSLFFFLCLPKKVWDIDNFEISTENETYSIPNKISEYEKKENHEQKHFGKTEITFRSKAIWFLSSAAGCSLLLAVTNSLIFDVASMPFLWVLPLCVYLSTFVLLFKKRVWYPAWIDHAFNWAVVIGILMHFLFIDRFLIPTIISLILMLSVLFILCMKCHKLLADNKPEDVRYLTIYYLYLSIGGAFGSLLVSGLAPLFFNTVIEYPAAIAFAVIAISFGKPLSGSAERKKGIFTLVAVTLLIVFSTTLLPHIAYHYIRLDNKIILALILAVVLLVIRGLKDNYVNLAVILVLITILSGTTEKILLDVEIVKNYRNFYGIYRVFDKGGIRYLQHGITYHGKQYLATEKQDSALLYYHKSTPAGEIFLNPPFKFNNIAMVGLGTGAMAAYLKAGQSMDILELDHDNLWIANDYFSYLKNAKTRGVKLNYVFGDGRVSLKKYADGHFDVLVIDAFSSGAIPTHLLTVEAVKEYLRVVKKDGLVLFHISNKYVNLAPIIDSVSKELKVFSLVKSNSFNVHPDSELTNWAAICADKNLENVLVKKYNWDSPFIKKNSKIKPWTDNYNNLFWLIF